MEKVNKQMQVAVQIEKGWSGYLLITERTAKKYLGANFDSWVDDIAQEAMIKAYVNADKFNSEIASFEGWLFTITRNLCFDFMRKKSNTLGTFICIDNVIGLSIDEDSADEYEVVCDLVEDTLNNLPERDKSLLSMKYFEDLSGREIAEKINDREQNIPTFMKRAKKRFKDSFDMVKYERFAA